MLSTVAKFTWVKFTQNIVALCYVCTGDKIQVTLHHGGSWKQVLVQISSAALLPTYHAYTVHMCVHIPSCIYPLYAYTQGKWWEWLLVLDRNHNCCWSWRRFIETWGELAGSESSVWVRRERAWLWITVFKRVAFIPDSGMCVQCSRHAVVLSMRVEKVNGVIRLVGCLE